MLTNAKELQLCKDNALSDYCKSKENCRRKSLVSSLGSEGDFSSTRRCCDVCSAVPPPEFSFIAPLSVPRKPRARVVRKISSELAEALMTRLLKERDSIVSEDVGLKMLGKELVLPTATLNNLCSKGKM